MRNQQPLSVRILSLVLPAAMLFTMLPATVFATEGDIPLGVSSTHTITAFDELGEGFTKSVPFDGHTYVLSAALNTPIEEIKLPTELKVTVERTTTTPPTKDEPAVQTAGTDSIVSGNEPATPSDAEPAPAPVEKPDADVPPADEPDQDKPEQDKETTVTETTPETIPVTWKGDREYTPDQNSKVIYTPVLPESYALKDGIKLPTIYVMVGMQARNTSASTTITTALNFSYATANDDCTKTTKHPVHTHGAEGPCWAWDNGSKTLTLGGVAIQLDGGYAIALPTGTAILQLKENTTNTIINTTGYGLAPTGSLTIQGAGALVVNTSKGCISGSSGLLTIAGGTITATAANGNAIETPHRGIIIDGGTGKAETKAAGQQAFSLQPTGTIGAALTNWNTQSVSWSAQGTSSITVNGGTEVGGATLETAITASGVAVTAVTSLKITAGEVTSNDWNYLKSLKAMTSFEIDAAVTSVANMPDATDSTTIFPNSIQTVTVPQATPIGERAFSDCGALTSVNFPEAISIGANTFDGCGKLTSVAFPKVTTLAGSAIYNCGLLESASLPEATTTADYALGVCGKLTTVALPKATSISANTFAYSTQLSTIKLPSIPPAITGSSFSGGRTPRALELVDADGNALTGVTLITARAAYKAVNDGDSTDNLWYGWTIEPGPSITVSAQNGMPPIPILSEPVNDPLAAFRKLFFDGNRSHGRSTDNALRTVFAEGVGEHGSPDYAYPALSEARNTPSAVPPSPKLDEERDLILSVYNENTSQSSKVPLKSTVVYQSKHANIWLPDDAEYHQQSGTIHDEKSCKLQLMRENLITPRVIADQFDKIFTRMSKDFGAHIVNTIQDEVAGKVLVGDVDNDQRINIVLHDINGSLGFFSPSDYVRNSLDMLHLSDSYSDVTDADEPSYLSLYSTIAHEYQHLLFKTYFDCYMSTAEQSNQYLWFNESLSHLAATFCAVPGDVIFELPLYWSAAVNPYMSTGQAYGDFVSHNNSYKNYGMELLFSVMLHRQTDGQYVRRVYDYLHAIPGSDYDEKSAYLAGKSMQEIVGGALRAGLDEAYSGISDTELFQSVYFIFMEHFAAEGGRLLDYDTGVFQVYPYLSSPSDEDVIKLWDLRQNPLEEGDISLLTSGEPITLNGYDGSSDGMATHDMLYDLGANQANSFFNIKIPADAGGDATRYYVAVLYPEEMGGTMLYYLPPDTDFKLYTSDANVYLFVSTFGADVDVIPTFCWEQDTTGVQTTMTPTYHSFPAQNTVYDSQTLTQTFTVSNTSEEINNLAFTLEGSFVFVGDVPTTVPANGTVAIEVRPGDNLPVGVHSGRLELRTTGSPGLLTSALTFQVASKHPSGGSSSEDDSPSGGGSFSGDGSPSGGGSFSGDGSPTSTAPAKPTGSVTGSSNANATVDSKGNATVNVTADNISDAVKAAQDAASKKGVNAGEVTLVINVTTPTSSNPNTVTINLPKAVQDQIISNKIGNVTIVIDKPNISIGMTLATITEMNKQANSDIQLSATRTDTTTLSTEAKSAIGSRPAFDLKATYASGAKSITNFGSGTVSVAIPYTMQSGELASGLYAVYVDGNGKVNYLTNSSYDADTKMLRFATNHFSVYGISYKAPVSFTDIANHWAKTDIEFAANRGLLSGTSSTIFAPDSAMTRGMFVAALGKLTGIDTNSYKTGKFTDVKADAYYAPYVNWASDRGIVKGTTDTTFAPNQAISRQEMAVIMSNYAKAHGYTAPQARDAVTFADNANIASLMAPAVKQMQMAGIINGKNGNRFDPTGTATRGEISAMLRRYMELVIDRTTAEGWTTNDSGSSLYYKSGKAVTGTQTISGVAYNFNSYGETTRKGATGTNPVLPSDGKNYTVYMVKKNDLLSKIALANGCTLDEIMALNSIQNPNLIFEGQKIKVPQR